MALRKMLVFVLLFIVCMSPSFAKAASSTEQVSVKLKNYVGNQTQISLAINGSYLLNNSAPLTAGKNYTVKVENSTTLALYENGVKIGTYQNSFLITPVQYGVSNYANINGRNYLGNMQFTIEAGAYVRPVNTLLLEDYLKGVVPGEMPASWSIEALKAQAVAARTYVKSKSGAVIDDTVSYQAYAGYIWGSSLYNNSSLAVDQTAGKVLRYNGNLISAVYSSSNGGFIESNANYWGSAQVPYLAAKRDPYDPKIPWNIALDKQQINTSQLDLIHPEQWWDKISESQASSAVFRGIKSYVLTNSGAADIKITDISNVSFADEFTKTASGESTGNRTKGTIHIEYFMKDKAGNFVRSISGNQPDINTTTIAGNTRYETSVAISKEGWSGTADTVVLGRGDVHVDAITGAVLAKKYNAPLLLTTSSAIPDIVFNRIKELNPKQIYLLGGEAAISNDVKITLENQGYQVERVNGETRYDTAVEIAKKEEAFSEVFITNGSDTSPDALSIASYAASKQIPIILSNPNWLNESVLQLLQDKQIKKVTLIGGTTALSTNIENQLNVLGISNIERISGETRYDTSIAIANKYNFDKSKIYFAQGRVFIDALPGAVLSAYQNAPVILTEKDSLPQVSKQWIKSLGFRPSIVYLGGNDAISPSGREQIKGALIGDIKKFKLEVNDTKMSVLRSMMGASTFKSYLVTNVQDTSSQFIINGLGYGHGVGMSQYGAKSMADQGFKYDQILGHYYTGASLSN
ncbi:SpoIID/LytB domain-containing protein [Neobacillus sp. OS1-2]|uniref:SpoIID/LytB domain-containing protein n=1 Tax=Neobacillus sp. OS1-2 TaxID=3070680 RepID=UPI0027E05F9D|nr:SpoIID/LytB domain-containing protein [Neobacillus sp. OS1-2]WML41228.1 SpoIID/LytB domain-containing protein [Neobacillus sp. OS1-2]